MPLTVRREIAEERNLETISDLVPHSDLRVFVTHEFIEREDGWPGSSVGLRGSIGFQLVLNMRWHIEQCQTVR